MRIIRNRFTFCSGGNDYQFKPDKDFFDPWENSDPTMRSKRITMLDFHMDLVRLANRPDTYILDSKGVEVEVK